MSPKSAGSDENPMCRNAFANPRQRNHLAPGNEPPRGTPYNSLHEPSRRPPHAISPTSRKGRCAPPVAGLDTTYQQGKSALPGPARQHPLKLLYPHGAEELCLLNHFPTMSYSTCGTAGKAIAWNSRNPHGIQRISPAPSAPLRMICQTTARRGSFSSDFGTKANAPVLK